MTKDDRDALIALPIISAVGAFLAFAGSQGGTLFMGLPVYVLCVLLAFVIQWVAFVPAFLTQTEKYYDLTGSATYISVILLALGLSGDLNPRSLLLAALMGTWALRLGSFLFMRIHATGKDSRFDDIKPSFLRFLMAWTLQGLWVCFSLAAGLAAITSPAHPLGLFAAIGTLIWIAGFGIEAIADHQKNVFRKSNTGGKDFIHTGLWSWSRHPNYFGEIVLWIGIAIIAFPTLQGWQFCTLISPVFITLLLTKISGVPMLEEKADKKWGGQPDYEAYKARTSVLVLMPPKETP